MHVCTYIHYVCTHVCVSCIVLSCHVMSCHLYLSLSVCLSVLSLSVCLCSVSVRMCLSVFLWPSVSVRLSLSVSTCHLSLPLWVCVCLSLSLSLSLSLCPTFFLVKTTHPLLPRVFEGCHDEIINDMSYPHDRKTQKDGSAFSILIVQTAQESYLTHVVVSSWCTMHRWQGHAPYEQGCCSLHQLDRSICADAAIT